MLDLTTELKKACNEGKWTHEQARELCVAVEPIAQLNNCHVALTGGCLYKNGERKDCDLLFYGIRKRGPINRDQLISDIMAVTGIRVTGTFGWVVKCQTKDLKGIDMLFPEYDGDGDYPQDEEEPS